MMAPRINRNHVCLAYDPLILTMPLINGFSHNNILAVQLKQGLTSVTVVAFNVLKYVDLKANSLTKFRTTYITRRFIIQHQCITYLSGDTTEPAATESVSHFNFRMRAFTAHPYKNLVVCSWNENDHVEEIIISSTRKELPALIKY